MLKLLEKLYEPSQQSLFGDESSYTKTFDSKNYPRVIGRILDFKTEDKQTRFTKLLIRACFKAQLPNFFITKLTMPDDTVYDPFSGRGTTVIEAALKFKRNVIANDINPISRILIEGRFTNS